MNELQNLKHIIETRKKEKRYYRNEGETEFLKETKKKYGLTQKCSYKDLLTFLTHVDKLS